jgi:hypothetical protein
MEARLDRVRGLSGITLPMLSDADLFDRNLR